MENNEINFQREVLDRLTKIEVKLDGYDKIKEQAYTNQRDILTLKGQDEQIRMEMLNQKKDIESLKDTNKWLTRTIAGVIISIVIAVIVGGIKLGLGG